MNDNRNRVKLYGLLITLIILVILTVYEYTSAQYLITIILAVFVGISATLLVAEIEA